MKFPKALTVFALIVAAYMGGLSGCSEARYAAHVVKQIPMGSDSASKNKGYFKVGSSYTIKGKRYYPKETYSKTEVGTASWYGPGFDGKMTANGEIFDKDELTAAHRTLQMPSIIRVTNLGNGRSIILRVNDRGPFAHNRILDVSERAASLLGFKNAGTAKIKLEVLEDASRVVGNAAKQGKSTNGYEVALNQNKQHYLDLPQRAVKPPAIPQTRVAQASQSTVVVSEIQPSNGVPQNILNDTMRNPAPVETVVLSEVGNVEQTVKTGSVIGGQYYVQAASFSQEPNAIAFSREVSGYGPSKVHLSRVEGKPFYRVRLGPYDNELSAQQAAQALNNSGKANAVVVAQQ